MRTIKTHLNSLILRVIVVLLAAASAAAQTGQLRGRVVLTQPNGSIASVAGALIDIYRNDKAEEHKVTTDKSGGFKLNLPYKGSYIVAVSAPNTAPKFFQNIKAGRGDESNLEIILTPGDGRRLSLDDIRKDILAEAANPEGTRQGHARSAPVINTTYDRFRDETTVSVTVLISKPSDPRFEMLGPYFSLYAAFVFTGQTKPNPPPFISFGFTVREFEGTKRILPQRFSNPVEFIVLYDGKRYNSAMNAARVRNNLAEVIDVVLDQLPTTTFNSIVSAQAVEIRVGVNELRLTESQLSALREFTKTALQ